MTEKTQMKSGMVGTVIAAICCFTPFLVVLFGFAGVSAWLGWIDYALFPILFASLGVIANALYIRSGRYGPAPRLYIVVAVLVFSGILFWLEFRFAIRITIAAMATVGAYAYYLHRHKTQPVVREAAED